MNFLRVYFFVCAFLCITTFSSAQKIGLLMDSYVIDRWYKDQAFFAEHVKALGGECLVEVAYGDADAQVKLGQKLIDAKVDVLVIVPVDAVRSAEIVRAAKQANIPVISYDRLITSKDLTFYISYNNFTVGTLQAKYAIEKVPTGNYLLINGPVSDNNAILFRKGQLSVLQPSIDAGKIKIVDDFVLSSWSEMETMMKVEEFNTSGKPRPNAILAANDAIAMGVVQTIPKEMLGKVVVTGQDADLIALKYIVDGEQSMTIYKPIKPLAYQAAEIAMKLARKEKLSNTTKMKVENVEIPAILLTPIVVDKKNYKETVVKDGHVKLSDIEKKK
jgi:D-xylose transport system substrate-binding protein